MTLDGIELLPGQQRIWQSEPQMRLARFELHISGPCDLDRLRRAVARLVEEHEVLRIHVLTDTTGKAVQVVGTETAHWQPLEEAEAERGCDAPLELSGPLELNRGPILWVALIRHTVQSLLLRFTLPALVADSALPSRFCRLLAEAYDRDANASEDDLPFQFLDFCQWRAENLAEERGKEQQYWRGRDLPQRAGGNGAAAPPESDRRRLKLSPLPLSGQTAEIEAALLAAWSIVLAHGEGEELSFCGVFADGRDHEALETMLGPAGSFLPLQIPVPANRHSTEFLSSVAKRLEEARSYQGVYFPELLADLSSPRFGFEHHRHSGQRVGELTFICCDQWVPTEDFTLQLVAHQHETELRLELHYRASEREQAEIARLGERLVTLLGEIKTRPDATLRQLEAIGAEERQALLRLANGLELAVPETTLHGALEARAARSPEAVALFFEGASCDFATLNVRANRLAYHLRRRGVQPETPVAICMRRGIDMLVSVFAALKAGGFYVPLDPKDPERRLRDIVEDAAIPLMLTEADIAPFTEVIPGLEICIPAELHPQDTCDTNLGLAIAPENLAYTIYTSGTTGRPKGVQVSHATPLNLMVGIKHLVYADLSDRPLRVSMNAPLTFDASVQQIVMILEGHCLCIIPEEIRMDGKALVAYIDQHRLDLLDCTPAHLAVMVEAGLLAGKTHAPLRILSAGGAIQQEFWDVLAAAPATRVFNIYGPTECTVDATGCPVETPGLAPSIGPPLANYQIFFLDAGLRLAPFGTAGELCIGGAGLARGYLARPALVAETFVPHPYATEPGQRLYRTGDLASYLPSTRTSFIGRIDDQLKLRGYRIEPSEIEQVLVEHAMVQRAFVMARTVTAFGPEKRLVAYICPATGVIFAGRANASALERTLREYLADRLPHYMVPPHYVILERLPLTISGKIDRNALPEPSPLQDEQEQSGTRPGGSAVAELLTGMWRELLGLDHVDSVDDFFELGGHSLLVIQLVGRIRHVFKIDLDLLRFFGARDLQSQVELIEQTMRAGAGLEAPPMVEVDHGKPQLASFSQQRLWFVYQVDRAYDAYHIPAVFRVIGALDLVAMERTLAEIIRRQKTLRTTFRIVDGQVMQVIAPSTSWQLKVTDFGGMSRAASDELLSSLAERVTRKVFDLERGPLLRVHLIRLTEREHAVIFTMHHIVSDGWSMGLLVQELVALYSTYLRHQPHPLPELSRQFVDYAVWQRQLMQSDVLKKQLQFWRDHLKDAPTLLRLPYDHSRPESATEAAGVRFLELSETLCLQLNQVCQDQGVTPFMLLFTTFNLALGHFTGCDDLVVGTDVANRSQFETEKIIGFFINQLPLRTVLAADTSLNALLERNRLVSLEAFLYQDLPFDRLVETLQPQREAGVSPFFQVKFVLQNAPTHELELPGLSLLPLESKLGTTKLDLQLNMWEEAGRFRGNLVFKTEVFEASTMATFCRTFERAALALATEGESTIAQLREAINSPERQYRQDQAAAMQKRRFDRFKQLTGKASSGV